MHLKGDPGPSSSAIFFTFQGHIVLGQSRRIQSDRGQEESSDDDFVCAPSSGAGEIERERVRVCVCVRERERERERERDWGRQADSYPTLCNAIHLKCRDKLT